MTNALLRGGIGLVLVATFVSVLPARQAPVQAGSEAVPDLAMRQLSDFQIQMVNGRRMLRFTAMMVNVGDGHFEVRGSRSSTSQPMQVRQVIFETSSRTSPISRQILTGAEGKWSGDGHNHWHVQEMMRYDMWGSSGNQRGAKVGFCFLDSDPYNLGLPGAGQSSYYRGSWCQTTPSALNNRMGISIGWGDEYEWYLAWQWIDITGAAGRDVHDPLEGRSVQLLPRGERGQQLHVGTGELRLDRERRHAPRAAEHLRQRLEQLEVRPRHRVDLRRGHHGGLRDRPVLPEQCREPGCHGDLPGQGAQPAVDGDRLLHR